MKPSFTTAAIILGVFALNPAFAQTTIEAPLEKEAAELSEQEKKRVQEEEAKRLAELEKQRNDAIAAQKKAEEELAKLKGVPEKKELEKIDTIIDDTDVSEHGLKLSFSGSRLQVNGRAAPECAKRLYIAETKTVESENDEEAAPESKEDIDQFSGKVGISIGFHGDEEVPSFGECQEKFKKSAQVSNLGSLKHLGYSIDEKLIARAGFLDDSGEILIDGNSPKSPGFLKAEGLFKECKSCSVKKQLAKIKDLNLPWASALMKKIMEDAILATDSRIDEASAFTDLTNIHGELNEHAKTIAKLSIDKNDKKDLTKKIEALGESKLLTKNQIMMHDQLAICQANLSSSLQSGSMIMRSSGQAPGCPELNKHLTFVSDVRFDLSKLSGLDSAKKAEHLKISDAFLKGSKSRYELIASMDPANPEVRGLVNGRDHILRNKFNQMQSACNRPFQMNIVMNGQLNERAQARQMECQVLRQDLAQESAFLTSLAKVTWCADAHYTGRNDPNCTNAFAANGSANVTSSPFGTTSTASNSNQWGTFDANRLYNPNLQQGNQPQQPQGNQNGTGVYAIPLAPLNGNSNFNNNGPWNSNSNGGVWS